MVCPSLQSGGTAAAACGNRADIRHDSSAVRENTGQAGRRDPAADGWSGYRAYGPGARFPSFPHKHEPPGEIHEIPAFEA